MRGILLLLLLSACESGERITVHRSLEPAPLAQLEKTNQPEETGPLPVVVANDWVTVYYRHPLMDALVPRRREIFESREQVGRVKQVIDQLSIAPEDGYGIPIWPADTYVREVYLKDDTIVVDFDPGFLENVNVGASFENLMVKSLVNSLLDSFPTYRRVFVLIQGKVEESLLGHIDIDGPLLRTEVDTVIPDTFLDDRLEEEELPLEEPKPNLREGIE